MFTNLFTLLLSLTILPGFMVPLEESAWQMRGFHAPDFLPYERVRHVIEGRDGAVWIATWGGGVARFDGLQTTAYDQTDGLAANHTRNMAIDDWGGIWVCTIEGLSYIAPDGVVTNYRNENFDGESNDNFLSICIDEEGTVWCGAYDFQLFTIARKPGLDSQTLPDSFPYQRGERVDLGGLDVADMEADGIEDIVIDRDGNVWLGVNQYGIVCLSPEGDISTWDEFPEDLHGRPVIYDIALHPEDGIYAGIINYLGLFRKDAHPQFKKINHGIRSLLSYNKHLIVGGDNTVTVFYEPFGLSRVKDIYLPLSTNSIDSLAQFTDGSIWAGTRAGLFHFTREQWRLDDVPWDPHQEGFSSVYYFGQNHQNNLIIVNPNLDCYVYKDKRWKSIGNLITPKSADLRNDDLLTDSGEHYYALVSFEPNDPRLAQYAENPNGIYRITTTDPIQVKKLPDFQKDEESRIFNKLVHYNENELWLLSKSGLICWDGQKWHQQPLLNQNENRYATRLSLYKTPGGQYWFAGDGWVETGNRNGTREIQLPGPFQEEPVAITDIVAYQGEIWMSTLGAGILVYDDGEWSIINQNNGLPKLDISCLLSASDGILWAGLKSGGVLSYQDGRWIEYDSSEGILENIVIDLYEDQNQEIWAYLYRRMAKYKADNLPPIIRIQNRTETLIPNERAILSFNGLDRWKQTLQEDLVYSLRIFDRDTEQPIDDWSPFKPDTTVSTSPLPPGKYKVVARAQDMSRNTSTNPAVAQFTVNPYFWSRPAFYIPLLASLLIALSALLIWYQAFTRLKVSRARYQNLLDKDSATLVLNWDMKGNLIYCNEQAEKLFSSFKENFKMQKVREWFTNGDKDSRIAFNQSITNAVDNLEAIQPLDVRYQTGKQPVWISSYLRATQPADHKNLEIHAVGIDITQQVEAQSKLELEKISFQKFCDQAHVGIIYFNQAISVQYMNEAMKEILELYNGSEEYPELSRWTQDPAWETFIRETFAGTQPHSQSLSGFKIASKKPFFAVASAMKKQNYVYMMIVENTKQIELQQRIAEISQREQEKIGRELHDGLGQQLSALLYIGNRLKKRVEQRNEEFEGLVNELNAHLNTAIEQSRLVSRGLNPVLLQRVGLKEAVGELLHAYNNVYPTQLIFHYDNSFYINEESELECIYRIIREAVFNALKHANAENITVICQVIDKGREVLIDDDGVGLSQISPADNKGMGLQIMKYHADSIQASLNWESKPEGGTKVICQLFD